MGASGWSYFTSYQENIGKAFQELQQKVFESGNYGHACQYSSEMWLFRESWGNRNCMSLKKL